MRLKRGKQSLKVVPPSIQAKLGAIHDQRDNQTGGVPGKFPRGTPQLGSSLNYLSLIREGGQGKY